MHSESQNHTTFDASIGESPIGAANRRLRSRLEMAFRDVRAQSADAAPEQRRELRAALRDVCADARRAGLRAEQLLVLIKDVWSGLPAGISRVQTVRGDERLNYVISTCVDEYYGEPREDPRREPREDPRGEPREDPRGEPSDGQAARETSP
jgi:hypothetical protein